MDDAVKVYTLTPQCVQELSPSVATTPAESRGTRNETEDQGSCTNTDGHMHQCAISEARKEGGIK